MTDDCSLTIDAFCEAEGFKRSTYYKLRHLGLGPAETRFPGTAIVRISAAARREWRERMAALKDDQQVIAEARAASERAREAAKVSVEKRRGRDRVLSRSKSPKYREQRHGE